MERNKTYFFIDEAGDASFYAKRKKLLVGTEGFQPNLYLGMIALQDKKRIRNAVVEFMNNIKSDPLYNTIASVKNPDWYLHARGDYPDIRAKFFEFIRDLEGIKCYIVIGRKRLATFQGKHNSSEREFYFDMVYHLLKDRMKNEDEDYQIFLSAREKNTQQHLGDAVQKALKRDNGKRENPLQINCKFDIVRSVDTPELSIIDYLLWALNRYIMHGEERFFKALQHKYNLIIDMYDFKKYKLSTENNYYHKSNPFSKEKASEFRADGYLGK